MKQKYNDIDPDFKELVEKDNYKIIILIIFILIIVIFATIVLINNLKKDNNQESLEQNNNSQESLEQNENKNNVSKNEQIDNDKNNLEEVNDATKEYYCTDGYFLEENECVKIYKISPIVKYTCDEGKVSDKNCIIETKEYGKTSGNKNEYGGLAMSCEEGYTWAIDSFECYKIITTTKPATPNYSCMEGYTLTGTECIKSVTSNSLYKYTCPNGYKLDGQKCYKINE